MKTLSVAILPKPNLPKKVKVHVHVHVHRKIDNKRDTMFNIFGFGVKQWFADRNSG